MSPSIDYDAASIETLQADLGRRIEALRLGRNLEQRALASQAGVSRRTITRLESGASVSLDTLLRVMRALGLASRLATLLPDPTVQPVERVRRGKPRKRARGRAQSSPAAWTWADGGEES